jgi:hypothetical protein
MVVGMIPMIMRLLVYLLLNNKYTIQPVLINDVIVLGLVLNIGIFNERNGHFRYTPSLSDTSSTVSLILIVLFSGMFFFMVTNEAMPLFNHNALYFVSILFNVLSVFLCIIYIIICYPFLKNRFILKEGSKEE